jgi:hypothetical protein
MFRSWTKCLSQIPRRMVPLAAREQIHDSGFLMVAPQTAPQTMTRLPAKSGVHLASLVTRLGGGDNIRSRKRVCGCVASQKLKCHSRDPSSSLSCTHDRRLLVDNIPRITMHTHTSMWDMDSHPYLSQIRSKFWV